MFQRYTWAHVFFPLAFWGGVLLCTPSWPQIYGSPSSLACPGLTRQIWSHQSFTYSKKRSREGQRVACLGLSINWRIERWHGGKKATEKRPCKSAPWVISGSLSCEAQGEAKSASAWGAQAEILHRHTLTMVTLGLRRWHQNFTEDHIQRLCFRCDLP